jgi:O-6-methylguanine DNA methyltransferase
VWKKLFDLPRKLYSYTELAALVDNPQGVRAVAHVVALNPVAYVIPCHLVVPKESLDKAAEIHSLAQKTLFKGSDLYLLNSLDVGAYAYGSELKRELIKRQLAE